MNPTVEAFFQKPQRWQAELLALRKIMQGFPLVEEIKWGKPCYSLKGGNVAILTGFRDYCAVGFFKGALLADPQGLLVRPGENTQAGRTLRFSSLDQVHALAPSLRGFLEDAIRVEEAGLEVEKIKELVLVEELSHLLAQRPEVKQAFEALTPGRQRAYNLHFSGAKQAKTRLSRIEKCLPQILAGKGLNDR